MKVSVVIPTYNGAHKILNVLRSLEKQTVKPDEVLVVIDGSTDDTAALLSIQKYNFPDFRIIEQENGGRAKVRNRGAHEASGDLLIFLDDDMIASSECVSCHIYHHKHHEQSILTGGLREPEGPERDDFSGFKSWLNDKWSLPLRELDNSPMSSQNYFINAANCSILKNLFNRIKGFDERLNDAEDYDLATRALLVEIPLYFSNKAWAYHNESVTCRQYIKRLRQYAEVQDQLSLIKPDLYVENHKYKVIVPDGIKGTLFRSFCYNYWINSIDQNIWLWLPKKIRYKLYDLVITANGSFYPGRVKL